MKKRIKSRPANHLSFLTASFILALLWNSLCVADVGVDYNVVFQGVTNKTMLENLKAVSKMVALRDKPPLTLGLLRFRAKNDVDRCLTVLKDQGYYAAKVAFEIDNKEKPVLVTFHIKPGKVFLFRSVTIEIVSKNPGPKPNLPAPRELGIKKDEPARTQTVINAQVVLVRSLKAEGYPFARIVERKVVVDHRTYDVTVTFRVDPGCLAHFGQTKITGLQSVNKKFVIEKLPWQKGDRYSVELLSKAQKQLTETSLFAMVRVYPAKALDSEGLLPIFIELKERKHRTISVGANYQTDTGPRGKLSWKHRNLLHNGEQLGLTTSVSRIKLSLDGSFQKPTFFRNDQTLVINAQFAYENADAYTSRNTTARVLVERKFHPKMLFGLGPAFRASRVDALDDKDDFALLSLPVYFDWDSSNNLLDPSRGGRLSLRATPFLDVQRTNLGFVKGLISYSHFYKIREKPFILFAGRTSMGSIVAASRNAIPADLRFYAGGGGSIRGYTYQKVGPLVDNDPIGGRSLIEFSTELRFKLTNTLGFVAFLDGGSVFETSYPDFSETIRWGAGPGIRYHTPIGPLRLDFAVPLNRRSEVDDPFQIYLGIGQAF